MALIFLPWGQAETTLAHIVDRKTLTFNESLQLKEMRDGMMAIAIWG